MSKCSIWSKITNCISQNPLQCFTTNNKITMRKCNAFRWLDHVHTRAVNAKNVTWTWTMSKRNTIKITKINNWSTCCPVEHANWNIVDRYLGEREKRSVGSCLSGHRLPYVNHKRKICIPFNWYLLVATRRQSTMWREMSCQKCNANSENRTKLTSIPFWPASAFVTMRPGEQCIIRDE